MRVTTLSYFLSLDSLQVFLRRPLSELCASVSIQILMIHEIVCCGTAAQARIGTSLLVHLIRNHTLSHIILEFSLFVVDSCRFSFCSVLFCNLQKCRLSASWTSLSSALVSSAPRTPTRSSQPVWPFYISSNLTHAVWEAFTRCLHSGSGECECVHQVCIFSFSVVATSSFVCGRKRTTPTHVDRGSFSVASAVPSVVRTLAMFVIACMSGCSH